MWSFHGPFLGGSEVFSEKDNHFPPTKLTFNDMIYLFNLFFVSADLLSLRHSNRGRSVHTGVLKSP